ncbi:MAG: ankyrin repeat domain-containing protein [Flavobacteriaceae bacterium]|nr:ankyrin repeat domain-containing protein [Bacteroidia bacterium]NNF81982.1 ankyrin repeat domain-containing protein [Flavobacteriaceae bacterium]NNK70126.1 ankyrin repeat domain-containing protein [Flavobacteriaceae bacterium]
MNRKTFLRSAGFIGLGLASAPTMALISSQNDEQLDKALVKEFVGKSHSDPDRVKELLKEHPTLLNAAHDWKFGDFETGLGAASHVGNKELVRYFLDHGAQANIFTMALFGQLDLLKQMLEFSPKTLHAKGPHGFTLLHHAERGGEKGLAVKDYLVSKGLTKAKVALY